MNFRNLTAALAVMGVVTLSGCASSDLQKQVDQLRSDVNALQSQASGAMSNAQSAQKTADMAMSEAKKAQQMAMDTEEKTKRMMDKCCGK